jgi:hypothetical protein
VVFSRKNPIHISEHKDFGIFQVFEKNSYELFYPNCVIESLICIDLSCKGKLRSWKT